MNISSINRNYYICKSPVRKNRSYNSNFCVKNCSDLVSFSGKNPFKELLGDIFGPGVTDEMYLKETDEEAQDADDAAEFLFADMTIAIEFDILGTEYDSIPQEVFDRYNKVFFPVDNHEVLSHCYGMQEICGRKIHEKEVQHPKYEQYQSKMESAVNLYYNRLVELNLEKSPELDDFVSGFLNENQDDKYQERKLSDDGKTIIKYSYDEKGRGVTCSSFSAETGTCIKKVRYKNKFKDVQKYVEFKPDGSVARFVQLNKYEKPHYEMLFPDSGHDVIANIYNPDGSIYNQRAFDYVDGELILAKP